MAFLAWTHPPSYGRIVACRHHNPLCIVSRCRSILFELRHLLIVPHASMSPPLNGEKIRDRIRDLSGLPILSTATRANTRVLAIPFIYSDIGALDSAPIAPGIVARSCSTHDLSSAWCQCCAKSKPFSFFLLFLVPFVRSRISQGCARLLYRSVEAPIVGSRGACSYEELLRHPPLC